MKEGLSITFLVVKYVLVTLISFHSFPKSTKSSIMCVVQKYQSPYSQYGQSCHSDRRVKPWIGEWWSDRDNRCMSTVHWSFVGWV